MGRNLSEAARKWEAERWSYEQGLMGCIFQGLLADGWFQEGLDGRKTSLGVFHEPFGGRFW